MEKIASYLPRGTEECVDLMKKQFVILALTTGLMARCATPEINWDSRLGTYRFDQAVKEYELPAKMHRLTDGRKALEWYLGSGQRVAPVKCAGPGYESGIGVSQTGQQYYELNLHLTFTTNDILSTWSKDQIGLHVRRPSNDGNLIMLSGTTVCALGLNV